ncbi:MAG TPA: hypothetical protein VM891_09220, partial [Amaricoccus sp.]|nr:hypothetical protein [Amaricoccus sp.]
MAFLHRPLVPEGRAARVLPCEGAVPCPEASRPWVLFVTILASAMAFIDGSVVTIAIPVMQRELGAGLAALQWVVNGYTLFLGALILVGGGRRSGGSCAARRAATPISTDSARSAARASSP